MIVNLRPKPSRSDRDSALRALLDHASIPDRLHSVYIRALDHAAGIYDRFIPASDAYMGAILASKGKLKATTIPERTRRKHARIWRNSVKHAVKREATAGVRFIERRVPDGKDPQGRSLPAQIKVQIGVLREQTIETALQLRGPRKTCFNRAAVVVVEKYRNEIGAIFSPAIEKPIRSMSIKARVRRMYADLRAIHEVDPQTALFFIEAARQEFQHSNALTSLSSSVASRASCDSYWGHNQAPGPGTYYVPGDRGNAQENYSFEGQKDDFSLTSGVLAADLFCSIKATRFCFLRIDDKTGKTYPVTGSKDKKQMRWFKRDQFGDRFEHLRGRCEADEFSLAVRCPSQSLIHLDDCSESDALLLARFSFCIIETSEKSFHVFLALKSNWKRNGVNLVAKTRDRLLAALKTIHPDTKANSGRLSVRWPGTRNHKQGRNSFLVRIAHSASGRFTSANELRLAGLLAEAAPKPIQRRNALVGLPDYQRILMSAPPAKSDKRKGDPDRSSADMTWCLDALLLGATPEQAESGLRDVSECARKRGDRYVSLTVAKAIKKVGVAA